VNLAELRAVLSRLVERQTLHRRNVELEVQLDERYGFESIIGSSPPMLALFRTMRQVSATDVTVLVTGESGTGKELVARAIHQNSRRVKAPLVTLNCAALPESLLESELFGHERGAFTGASARKVGYIEYAQGGTLFLDEVGDMPLTTQVKMLRVLEAREINRLGSNEPIPVDIRVVTATNKNLLEEVSEGRFREDLYFRLKVVSLELPPLRERTVDIPPLAEAFLAELSDQHRTMVKGLSPEVLRVLQAQPWPGNVRELRNTVERAAIQAEDGLVRPQHLGLDGERTGTLIPHRGALPLKSTKLKDMEEVLIRHVLGDCEGNRSLAARELGINRTTLYAKLKAYAIEDA